MDKRVSGSMDVLTALRLFYTARNTFFQFYQAYQATQPTDISAQRVEAQSDHEQKPPTGAQIHFLDDNILDQLRNQATKFLRGLEHEVDVPKDYFWWAMVLLTNEVKQLKWNLHWGLTYHPKLDHHIQSGTFD